MEQRGTKLEALAELDDLRALVERPASFLSVYLPLRPATEALADAAGLEWRAAREQAAESGAPEELLSAVDGQVGGTHRDAAGLCVVACPDGPMHVERLEVSPPSPLVGWGAAPALRPLVAVRQQRQPVVVAFVDRRGADLAVRTGASQTTATSSVEGATYPLRKVAGGGWSQRRLQQHVEETWNHNMAAVAEELTAVVERTDARLVAVGGDERALGLLRDHLPATVRQRVWSIGVTRADDGSMAQLDHEVGAVLDRWVHDRIVEGVRHYEQELGQQDRAVAGPEGTLAALRAGRVALLLVGAGSGDDPRGWLGETGSDVATTPSDLLHGERARSAPLPDVGVLAALTTGADVRVTPDDLTPPGGIGALLRW